jgi:type II secretion system protein G
MDRIYKMMKRNNKGFTLVELMVVLLIIGILVAIAIPIYNSTQAKAKERACEANLRTLDGAAAQYHAANEGWPNDINNLVPDYIQNTPKCPTNNGNYVWDSTNHIFTCPQNHTYRK